MVNSNKVKRNKRKMAACNRVKSPVLIIDGKKIVLRDEHARYLLWDIKLTKKMKLDVVADKIKKFL